MYPPSLLLNRALSSAMKPVGLCPCRELDSVPGTELVLWADLHTFRRRTSQLLKNKVSLRGHAHMTSAQEEGRGSQKGDEVREVA